MNVLEALNSTEDNGKSKPKSSVNVLDKLKQPYGETPFSSNEYRNTLEQGVKVGSQDPYKTSQEEEANSQSFGKQVALSTANSLSNIVTGTVGGIGYLGTLFEDSKGDYSNAITDWADSVRNPFGEVKRKSDKTIDLTDSAFWLDSGQSLVESAIQFGLIAESGGALATGVAGKLGNLLKLGNTANKVIKGSLQAMTAVELSYLEGAMSGATVYRDIYNNQFDKLTKKGLSIEEADKLAKKYASDGASSTVQLNTTIGTALNLTGIGSVFNRTANEAEKYFLKGAGKRLAGESVKDYSERIIKQSPQYLNEITKQNYGKLLSEMSQEGIEEVVTQLAENTGRKAGTEGKDLSYLEQFQSAYDNLNSVVNDEGVLNFALGAIGGISQTMLLDNVIPSQKVNKLSDDGNLIVKKDSEGNVLLDKKGNPVYETQRVSPRARDVYDNQQYYNTLKDSLFSDLSYIDDIQTKIVNTDNPVEKKELYRKLYSVNTLDSIYKGMGENLISSYQKILQQDNSTDLSEEPAKQAQQIQSQINDIKSKVDEKGELSEEQKNQIIELNETLKETQKKVADLTGVTLAMQLGLAKDKNDNDYKVRATKAINQIKQIDDLHKKNKDKYILPEEVNVNFAEYITKLQADVIGRQNIQQDLENDLLSEKANFQLFSSIDDYGDIENMILNTSLTSLVKETDNITNALKEYDKNPDSNILKDFVDTLDKKVYSDEDILKNLYKKVEENNKLIKEKEDEVNEYIKTSPSFQKSGAKSVNDYINTWSDKYPDFKSITSFSESLKEFTKGTESIKNKIKDVTSNKGRDKFINNHFQRIQALKQQVEAQHNVYSYEEARKANEDNYFVDKLEKINKEQEEQIVNEIKRIEEEVKQLEEINLQTNKENSFYNSLVNYFNKLSDITTLIKLRKNRINELQEYLKKVNEEKQQAKEEIVKEKQTPLEKQEVVDKTKKQIEKAEVPDDLEPKVLRTFGQEESEIPQGEGKESDNDFNNKLLEEIRKINKEEKEAEESEESEKPVVKKQSLKKKEIIIKGEEEKKVISKKIQDLEDKIKSTFGSKEKKNDRILTFVFNFIKSSLDSGDYNLEYLSDTLLDYIHKNIRELSGDEKYNLQLKLYSFSDDVLDLMFDSKKLKKELRKSFTEFKNKIEESYDINLAKQKQEEVKNKVEEPVISQPIVEEAPSIEETEEQTPQEVIDNFNDEVREEEMYDDPFTLDMFRFQYGQIRDDNSLTKDALETAKLQKGQKLELKIDKSYQVGLKDELPIAIYLKGSDKKIGYLPTIEFINTTYIKDNKNNYKPYNLEGKNQRILDELYDVLNQISYLKLDKNSIISQEGKTITVNYKEYNEQKVNKIRKLFSENPNITIETKLKRKSGGRAVTQKTRQSLEGIIDNNDSRVKVHTLIKGTLYPSIESEISGAVNKKLLAVLSYPDINGLTKLYPLSINTLSKDKINTLKELFTLYYKSSVEGDKESIDKLNKLAVSLNLKYDLLTNFDKLVQQYFTTLNYLNDVKTRRNDKLPSLIYMPDANGKKGVNLFALKPANSNSSYNLDKEGFKKFIDNLETELTNKLFTLDNDFLENGQTKGFKHPVLEGKDIVVKGGGNFTYYDYIKNDLETNFDVNKDNFIINSKGQKELVYTKDFVVNFDYNYKVIEEKIELSKNNEIESDDSDEDVLDSVFSINDDYIKKPEIKEGVNFVFEQNSELFDVGTKQEYSEYLKTIFPDSKIKGILKHTSKVKFEKFKKGQGRLGEGIYLADFDYKLYDKAGENVYRVIVNISNLKRYDKGEFILQSRNLFPNEDEYSNQPQLQLREADKKEGVNAYVSTGKTGTEYVVFESEQIHILGSKQDIEQFKKWIKQNRKYSFSFLESFKNSVEKYKNFVYDFININVILNDELPNDSKNKYLEEASKVQSMKDANELFNKICKE